MSDPAPAPLGRATTLVTRELSLGDLLGGRYRFELPVFQRAYRWGPEQVERLYDDVTLAALDQSRDGARDPYFLGPIVLLSKGGGDATRQPVDVIDGQQRLITLTLLLAVLRDHLPASERSRLQALIETPTGEVIRGRIGLGASDAAFLAAYVQEAGATRRRMPDPVGATQANLAANRAMLARLVHALSPTECSELVEHLLAGCRVAVLETNSLDYAYQIFLSMNDRGLPLDGEEILKAEILGPLDETQLAAFAPVISEFDRYLGEARNRPRRGKTFFSHLRTIYGGRGRPIVEEVRRLIRRTGGPAAFASQVFVPLVGAYLLLKQRPPVRTPRTEQVEQGLAALQLYECLGDDDWVPVAMLWMSRFADDLPATVAFLRALDRLVHAVRAIGGGAREREKRFRPIREALLEATAPPEPVRLLALSPSLQRAALSKIAKRCWSIDAQMARLVLARVDAHLSGRPVASYEALLGAGGATVEHILPRSDKPDAYWRERFPDGRRRFRLSQALGNLALVSIDQNRQAAARAFPHKQAALFANGPSEIMETEALRQVADWDEPALTARHERLMRAVVELWALEGPIGIFDARGAPTA